MRRDKVKKNHDSEKREVKGGKQTGSTSTSAQDSSGDITGSGSAAPTVAESINVPVGSSTWEESASTAKFEDDDVGARDSQNRIAYYENRIAELERDVAKVKEENVK
ncbi:hypothetical protein Pcinc_015221 [Petrolisthes cinctipes]|uniref:Uncharacterized protein n=1 Tax=Petrolisthes cinctipes TaxID=88211 RepID=A0AAE1FTH5_PETCI|nr:hypothetical protein Pcinc_015221 [Petrolisthes cinctipes]